MLFEVTCSIFVLSLGLHSVLHLGVFDLVSLHVFTRFHGLVLRRLVFSLQLSFS
jgi:hypothetical protein